MNDAEPTPEAAPVTALATKADAEPRDPYKGRKDAIDALSMAAYGKASQLLLTPEEIGKMQAEFPDDAFRKGAAGKDNLIYIEHAHLRDRMNDVFGPGQWAIIPRNRWTSEFTTAKGTPGIKVYVEAMLLIRGCFVAEAVGDMDYWPKNEQTNFGDAVEGAKTAALRRCVKELGIGLQAWKKAWCEGWWQRNPTGRAAPSTNPEDLAVTGEQIKIINQAIEEYEKLPGPKLDGKRFWPIFGVEGLHALPQSRFAQCVGELARITQTRREKVSK